ncbi:translation initiation factor eIF-2B epsilon subunit, GEF [Recurvomyces mirabilis]|nr:translation initiation factor eIF-2B epsilon subunit, GEF [Recurvomyces mirabilis]
MGPKAKKNAVKGSKTEDGEKEPPLQAVVHLDAFEDRFLPFTLERPRCLLTLANTPLIEYTLEWLASVGVEEVYLYSGNHTEQIEDYLNSSRWTRDTSPFTVELIHSPSTSIGDNMRNLDQKEIMKGDFLSVYGDIVANIPLEAALQSHKSRRQKNKNAIMTMILREAGDYHRTKDHHMRRCFVIDPATDRCIHYEQVKPRHSPRLNIPEEVLKDHVEIDMREDLLDCGIDICTPDALAQWSDSFDWKMPRKDFVHGVLQDYETFGRTIHTYIVSGGYAARANTLKTYNAVSKDVISRWAYPYGPDMNLVPDQSFQLQKGTVYKEDGVILARSSMVGKKSVLGKATSIGEGSVVTNSVIGRRCVIGRRVRIEGAYIWDDVSIGDDTKIKTAIVANEVSVGRKCEIKRGALLSYGVHVGDGTTVKEDTRITRTKRKREHENNELSRGLTDNKIVGKGGEGFELQLDEEEEEEVVEALRLGFQGLDLTLVDDDISDLDSDEETDTEYEQRSNSRTTSFTSNASDESRETRRNKADFHHEASSSIFDALQREQDPDNIQLELKALRMTSNAEDSQVRRAVAVAFSKRITNLIESGKSPKEAVDSSIPANQRLITSCVKETEEQAEFLLFLQTDLVHRPQGNKILLFAVNVLAENDMVDGEGLKVWWEDARSSASEELEAVRKETQQIVDIMADDSDEEEDDEEDDDEDED